MTNKNKDNLNSNSKKSLYIFVVISTGIGFITLLLALKLSPWFYAINTSVRFHVEAPAETKISICWDDAHTQCLPFVPYSTKNNRMAEPGEIADIWMSELPPRPAYFISLIFKSGFNRATFQELELDSSKLLLFGTVQDVGITDVRFGVDHFKLSEKSGRVRLTLDREIIPGPSEGSRIAMTTIIVWGLLFSIYLLIAFPIYLLPYAIGNLGSAIKAVHVPKYSWWIYTLCGSAILVMQLLVLNSGVLFNEYDSLNYLSLALSGKWFSDTRLPGYPLFLGLALWMFRNNLDGAIFLQAIILALSVVVCIWALRRWIPGFAALLFVLLSLLSPAQIHWARWILRESLFTSLLLLGITTAIAHFTSPKPLSRIWLYVFSAICGFAFLVRENGILLPVALLPVLVPEIFKRWLSSGTIWERGRSVLSFGAHYLSPIMALGIIYVIFSTYNYLHYGYFQVGIHQTSHSFLARTIYPGNSNLQSLLDPGTSVSEEAKSYHGWSLYSSFVLARDQTPTLDPVYMALYPSVIGQMLERGLPNNTFHLANILNEIGRGMNFLVPLKADLSGILRQYTEVLSLRTNGFYTLEVENPYATASRQELLDRLPIRVKLEEKLIEPDSILAVYYKVTQGYQWYGLLLTLALLSSIYIVRFEDPMFLAPIAIFVANGIMLIVTRLVSHRYLVNLDVLLVLQTIFGLSLWVTRNHYAKRFPIIDEKSMNLIR